MLNEEKNYMNRKCDDNCHSQGFFPKSKTF